MVLINSKKKYCYRITHIENLECILENGLVTKHHSLARDRYINIGNPEIIDVRSSSPVKIEGYGYIGDYVPFYFTPRSIMLYNIITGYWHPKVPKRNRNEILVIRCLIEKLADPSLFFFTDGQGNDSLTNHYNDLTYLDEIDWESIQHGNFSKTDDDIDRARRYQAEFLVRNEVPVSSFESLNVYNRHAAKYAEDILKKKNINLVVNVQPKYFF